MIKLLFLTAELFPLIKTGGLADYSKSLPSALQKNKNIEVKVMIPGYPNVIKALKKYTVVAEGYTIMSPRHSYRILEGKLANLPFPLLVIDSPRLFNREGSPYVDSSNNDWSDNFERFATLSMMPYLMCLKEKCWHPNIVHANDWHPGLFSAYLLKLPPERRPKTVFTIHNIAFQGVFPYELLHKTGLTHDVFDSHNIEYFNKLSLLKAGVMLSDKVLTVSPQYAQELCASDSFGMGFSGILKSKGENFFGILNGAEYSTWSPLKDKALAHNFGVNSLEKKILQKKHLQKEIGLPVGKKKILMTSVSRLSEQKGLDLICEALENILPKNSLFQFIGVGTGDKTLEERYKALARQYPNQVRFFPIYSEELAHKAIGSSDVFLMPSRFEPCGLTQIYSLKYGTVPIVTPVGGLLDTVTPCKPDQKKDEGTGFITQDVSVKALIDTILKTFLLFKNVEKWTPIMKRGMKKNFSWDNSKEAYKKLYDELQT